MGSAGGLLSSAVAYIKARKDLLALEGKTAGAHYGVIAGLFGAAVIMLFVGYLFLVATLVYAVVFFVEDSHRWLWALGGAAFLHILVAVIMVLVAKSKLKTGVFATTIEELKKDTAWLQTLPKKS